MSSHGSSTKAILYALFANLGIAIAKGVAAFITGSGSMLAETVHSFADCGNQLLLFLGLKKSKKEATADYPMGFGKSIFFWSFVVAIMLFSMGGLFSIYEGIHKISEPEELSNPVVALVVLGLGVLLEGGSLLGAMREIKKTKGDQSYFQWAKNTRQAEMVVIFGEDLAAIVGLSIAFVFVLIAMITGNPIFDSLGSIVIGAILILISIFLITRLSGLLIGKSADPELVETIEEQINADKNIVQVFRVITLQLGHEVMLSAKIKMAPKLKIEEACEAINRLEDKIQQKFPEITWCFIEPDVKD